MELFHVSRPFFFGCDRRGDTRGTSRAAEPALVSMGIAGMRMRFSPATQVAEIDVAVDVRCEARVAVPQNALRDDERHACTREQRRRGRAQVMEADRPVHRLRPELHGTRGAVAPGRVGMVLDVRGPTCLAATAAVVVTIHDAGAREGSA